MNTTQRIIQRISAEQLDEILAQIAQEKCTDLAVFGPGIDAGFVKDNWPKSLEEFTRIYQLSSLASDLCKKLSPLNCLTSLFLWGDLLVDSEIKHIATLTNLTTLYLRNNQIGEAGAKHIAMLTNLTTLYLRNNQIGEAGVKHLATLINLTSLNLDSNQISDAGVKYLVALTNLTTLNLGNNQIGDAGTKHIAALANLTTLNLAGNQIGEAGAKYIAALTNLATLYLGYNQIGDAETKHLAALRNLTTLHLGYNQIGDAGAKHIAALANLTTLELISNQIGEAGVKHLATLTNLTTLDLGYNQIGDTGAKHFAVLKNLNILGLRETAITDLTSFADLPLLQVLNVSNTSVNDLSPLRSLLEKGIAAKWESYGRDNGIYVKDCPLIYPPPETVQQGHAAVLNYFREIDAQGTDKLMEAKVLIVGEGRAGKTSLLRRLYQPDEPLPGEDETTKGINICQHHFPLKDGRMFRLNVWDFGGQQIYHATHQFFLTKNSLYILLDDTAKDYKSVTDEGFRYWLEVIDLLSKHSPVLIFQNEKGGRSKQIDIVGVKSRFDNVEGVYRGNLALPESATVLAGEIEHRVQQLPHVGENVPAKWVDIRRAIEQETERTPYITQQDYFDLYQRYLEFDRTKALRLSQYLHDLGVFLHFQDDDLLRNIVILQNRWATEAVFRILDDETVKANFGQFTSGDCERIWADSEYRDMHPELRMLMEKFELCYVLPDLPRNEKTWLTPQLLSLSIPQALVDWEKPGDLVLVYHYHFLPRGLVNRLMVRKHRYVERPDMAWANGVLFENAGNSVLVQATSRGNEIILRARGSEAKVLLGIITADLDALNASYSGLEEKLQKLIPCNCRQCSASTPPELFEYKQLLKARQIGVFTIQCRESFEDMSVGSLLDGFNPLSIPHGMQTREEVRTTEKPETKTIKIFLASSEELRDDRDAFELYFRQQSDQLRKRGIYLEIIRWENYVDAMSGTRLQDEYNRDVRTCDIFVSLFMTKTGSFTEEEFDVAYQAFRQTGKPLIYTYFKDEPTSIGKISKTAMQSLWKFQKKLKAMGHFWTDYKEMEHLKRQFSDQLDKLLQDGRI